MRRDHLSVVGNGRDRHEHLQRRDGDSLTEGVRAEVYVVPIRITRDLEPAHRFVGKVYTGAVTQPKAFHVTVKSLRSHLCGEPCHAHIQ